MVNEAKPAHSAQGRSGTPVKFVAAPVANLGVRNALRRAFVCEEQAADSFDQLLAKLN